MPRFLHHHISWSDFHYSEMGEIYVSLTLRSLALGVGGIFVPIYLFDLGYSLAAIALFYLIAALPRFALEIVNGYVISRFGTKHMLSASYIVAICYFIALYLIPYWGGWWYIAAVLLAFEMSWFWVSYHMHISHNRSKQKSSRQIGLIMVLRRVAAAAGPLVGGIIGAVFGLQYSLLLAATLLVLAVYPLFKTQDLYLRHKFKWKPIAMPRTALALVSWQTNSFTVIFLWPLFMYMSLRAYEEVGFITSATVVIGSFATYYIGSLGDKGKNPVLLKIGAVIEATANILRGWASSFGSFLGVNLLGDIAAYFLTGPFTATMYEQADKTQRLNYVINSQLWSTAGKTLAWSLVLILSLLLTDSQTLQAAFMLSAVAALFIPQISKQHLS